MLSSTLKRSAATLGVVAGLLAAAAPASAQILDGPVLAKAGPKAPLRIAAPDWDGSDKQSAYFLELSFDAKSAKEGLYFKAPGPTDGTQVGSEGATDNGVPLETVSFTFKGEVIALEPNALGTQVGSEGGKANNLRGEAIDIIP